MDNRCRIVPPGRKETELVVTTQDPNPGAPRSIAQSSEHPDVRFDLAEDLVAVHGEAVDRAADGPGAPGWLAAEGIDVRAADGVPPDVLERGAVGPVYRRVPSQSVVVPTGSVLVRFAEGQRAVDHEGDLAEAGFVIESVLSYASHAAWVRAASGNISDSLLGVGRLHAVPGVEHVEPQMVGESSRRDSPPAR